MFVMWSNCIQGIQTLVHYIVKVQFFFRPNLVGKQMYISSINLLASYFGFTQSLTRLFKLVVPGKILKTNFKWLFHTPSISKFKQKKLFSLFQIISKKDSSKKMGKKTDFYLMKWCCFKVKLNANCIQFALPFIFSIINN